MLSLKDQLTTPRSKKKTWQIHEMKKMKNQVDRREAAGSQTAERVSFVALVGPPKGVRVQLTTSATQAFLHQKTNNSMKTSPNETKSRLQAALWAEVLKWVSLGWVGASSHSLEGSRS
jgi:hypothetical protein